MSWAHGNKAHPGPLQACPGPKQTPAAQCLLFSRTRRVRAPCSLSLVRTTARPPLPDARRPGLRRPLRRRRTSIHRGKMASRAGGDGKEAINEQVVANTYTNMRTEMNQLYTKITELEMEVSEHSLVIGAIEPLDPSRRCYRMIGGVLVERTIKEVLPAVKRNKEGLEEVIARMHEALERKKKEITEFELKYKIRIRKANNDAKDEGGKKEGTAQGVLVGPAGQ
ncbi:hypothetical protein SORBI_3007G045201 [Sorghum bicolor]|uniref:Prefoldin subunit 2 n=2 Tax=Sorghum bicolor TaxID=4558 RepID=A0A1Z5R949_SORBI|nr:hypothetical protein SORBI_3007G045201 [Sorghum bicolor]